VFVPEVRRESDIVPSRVATDTIFIVDQGQDAGADGSCLQGRQKRSRESETGEDRNGDCGIE